MGAERKQGLSWAERICWVTGIAAGLGIWMLIERPGLNNVIALVVGIGSALAIGWSLSRIFRSESVTAKRAKGFKLLESPNDSEILESAESLTETDPAEVAEALATLAPGGLNTPRDSGTDMLTVIKGVDKRMEGRLTGAGIYHFDQIAAWNPEDVVTATIAMGIGRKKRIKNQKWVEQAANIVAEQTRETAPEAQAGG